MPFLNLNNNWSDLAPLYNQRFNNKPEVPSIKYSNFDDGFIRGGLLNATLATARDVVRVGKFITGLSNINSSFSGTTLQTATRGILFLTKQIGLQKSNPRLEWNGQPEKPIPLAGGATRQFTGVGSVLSVGGNAFGLHFDRAGLLGSIRTDQKYGGDNNDIKGVVWQNNFGEGKQSNKTISDKSRNRLVRYYNEIIQKHQPGNSIILDDYPGGPQSVYGLGPNTIIKTFPQQNTIIGIKVGPSRTIPGRTDIIPGTPDRVIPGTPAQTIGGGYGQTIKNKYVGKTIIDGNKRIAGGIIQSTIQIALPSEDIPATPDQIIPGTPDIVTITPERTEPGALGLSTDEDLNKKLNGFIPLPNSTIRDNRNVGGFDNTNSKLSLAAQLSLNSNVSLNSGYNNSISNLNTEQRIGTSTFNNIDAINVINITNNTEFARFEGLPNNGTTVTGAGTLLKSPNSKKQVLGNFGRDIIKFRIEFINNDTPSGNNTDVLAFRAYIDDFNDGMNAKWNSYRYMGRGEEFFVYEGFTRDISVAFTMFAHSPEEMKPLYRKLNYLLSTFAPDYSKSNKMRGNIAHLTVGDYLYRVPGVFTDIKLSGMLDNHWEIAYDSPENGESQGQHELPKHIKVNLSFKPIHSKLPRKVTAAEPFLSNFILPTSSFYQ